MPPRTGALGHLVAVCLLVLGAIFNSWDWFAADRMPFGDFPGYAAELQSVQDALLEHGRVPLWCVECYGGTSRFTSHLKEILAFPLSLWVGPVLAIKLCFVTLRLLAGLGLYAFVVRTFRAPAIGVIAGYAYAFGAVANHQLEHLDMALAAALVPPILIASVELLRRGGVGWALALGVLVACQLLNNWVYALSAPLAILLLLVFRPWREMGADANPWRDRRLVLRWLRLAVLALGVFLVFAGSQIAWVLTDAGHHRLAPDEPLAVERSIYVERSPFLYVNRDNVLGPWLEGHHPPGLDVAKWDGGRRYLGGVVLAVCLVGWLAVRRRPELRRWAAFAGWMFLIQYWLSLGPRTLLWEVAESLHVSPATQEALRLALLAISGACFVLAAWLGGSALRGARDAEARRRLATRFLSAAILLFFPTRSLWTELLPLLRVQRSPGHFFDTAPFCLYLLFAIALVGLARGLARPKLARALLALLALAVVADFWPSTRGFAAGFPMEPLRQASAMVRELEGAEGTLRILVPRRYSPLRSWLAGQAPPGHVWGWLPWQAGRHWADFIIPAAWSHGTAAEPAPDLGLLSMARVRYFLVGGGDGSDAVVFPPPWRKVAASPQFAVWEQPDVGPMASGHRAWVLRANPRQLEEPGLGARSGADNVLVVSSDDAASFEVIYRRPEPEHIVLELDAGPEPALVFVSEGHHPWWRAVLDGEPAPVLRAQYAFMAIPVGPGAHAIDLRFERPVLVATADRVTAVAWIGLGVAALVAAIRHGRRSRRARHSGPGSRPGFSPGGRLW